MEDVSFTVLESRSALVWALQVLRHAPDESIAAIFKAIYGPEMKDACAKFHASVYAKMFETLLTDFDERYMPQLIQRQAELDSSLEWTASPGGIQHMQQTHP